VRTTVESGERLSKSLDSTLQALRGIGEKIDPKVDYTPYFRDTTLALEHLNETVTGLNRLLEKDPITGQSKVTELTALIDKSSHGMADKVFERALLLLGVFFGGTILTLIVARLLFGGRRVKAQSN